MNRISDGYIFPLFWIHGEEHDVYRKMVKVMYDANCDGFCIESRPHENFGKEQWWGDVEVILTEAEKYGMKVWLLDDKHYPTGYANGAIINGPIELRNQFIANRSINIDGGKKIELNLIEYLAPQNDYNEVAQSMLLALNHNKLPMEYDDDSLLSCTAFIEGELIDLSAFIKDNYLEWDAPVGKIEIQICSLTRNTGLHRDYMSMINEKSCRVLIDEVYETHYNHFKERFGNTLLGFFSDEPELGNANYTLEKNVLGTKQSLPYSIELANLLEEKLGVNWKNLMPLLWKNDGDKKETTRTRFIYMDCVSKLVEKDFSKQIGTWCEDHNVGYIGHVIEDNNRHARTGASLGHYFRGLKYQTMGGIDAVMGQVTPDGEDKHPELYSSYLDDSEFYHYALGKLGSSLGALNPRMNGQTMCEMYGAYGWGCGVRMQKYILDHFMVRGINYIIPHAFTSRDFPDYDCPPHFFAQGNNPQYRHFGELMLYAKRVSKLISNGKIEVQAAILYHGEAEWCGEAMLMQKPARVLADNQIDFNFIPADAFIERAFYKTEIDSSIIINGRKHDIFIIPYSEYITVETMQVISELREKNGHVVFIDKLPSGCCTGEDLSTDMYDVPIVKLNELINYLDELNIRKVICKPSNERIRVMNYKGQEEVFYIFNEGDKTYSGEITLPTSEELYLYDAWNDKYLDVEINDSQIKVELESHKSMILITGKGKNISQVDTLEGNKITLNKFTQSTCRSIDYPNFGKERQIDELTSYALVEPKFSGFIKYETEFSMETKGKAILEITDAYEGVEVFVNKKSVGIQVVPSFIFDLTDYIEEGVNNLVIEVATTLEREMYDNADSAPTGITGEVNLYIN